jgi:hypothetical protein
MARNDWVAALTEPAAEYMACTELSRFGLNAYLPQLRKQFPSEHPNTVDSEVSPVPPLPPDADP